MLQIFLTGMLFLLLSLVFGQENGGDFQVELQLGFSAREENAALDSAFDSTFADYFWMDKYAQHPPFMHLKTSGHPGKNWGFRTEFVLQRDWVDIQNGGLFPSKMQDFHTFLNREALLFFEKGNLRLQAGRAPLSLGCGEIHKLLISENAGSLDHFTSEVRLHPRVKMQSIIANMRDSAEPNAFPKLLYLHRFQWQVSDALNFYYSEMLVSNQPLTLKYANPFQIYHNRDNFAEQRNVKTLFGLEYFLESGKAFFTLSIDEWDTQVLEQSTVADRRSLGWLTGLQLETHEADFFVEISWLDPWLNNYPYKSDEFGDLTFVVEEIRQQPDRRLFRYLGHSFGSNARAVDVRYLRSNWEFSAGIARIAEQGVFEKAFSRELKGVFLWRNYVKARWQFENQAWAVQASAGLQWVKNGNWRDSDWTMKEAFSIGVWRRFSLN